MSCQRCEALIPQIDAIRVRVKALEDAVTGFITDMDNIMDRPASYDRGQLIAKALGKLEGALIRK